MNRIRPDEAARAMQALPPAERVAAIRAAGDKVVLFGSRLTKAERATFAAVGRVVRGNDDGPRAA